MSSKVLAENLLAALFLSALICLTFLPSRASSPDMSLTRALSSDSFMLIIRDSMTASSLESLLGSPNSASIAIFSEVVNLETNLAAYTLSLAILASLLKALLRLDLAIWLESLVAVGLSANCLAVTLMLVPSLFVLSFTGISSTSIRELFSELFLTI